MGVHVAMPRENGGKEKRDKTENQLALNPQLNKESDDAEAGGQGKSPSKKKHPFQGRGTETWGLSVSWETHWSIKEIYVRSDKGADKWCPTLLLAS